MQSGEAAADILAPKVASTLRILELNTSELNRGLFLRLDQARCARRQAKTALIAIVLIIGKWIGGYELSGGDCTAQDDTCTVVLRNYIPR
jgi:hypothetical protein